ncbi:MAG: DUF4365 domain-containing protein [Faecousia sp.]
MDTAVFPKESQLGRTGSGGIALIHFAFNYEHWEFRQETGADRGRDCSIEYIDGNEWQHNTLQGQVKGTKSPETYLLKNGTHFSYPLDKKTIYYALHSPEAFLLFLCDLKHNIVYYLPIQEYFINEPEKYENLENPDTIRMNLHIPVKNTVRRDDDAELIDLAKATYIYRNNRVQRV